MGIETFYWDVNSMRKDWHHVGVGYVTQENVWRTWNVNVNTNSRQIFFVKNVSYGLECLIILYNS